LFFFINGALFSSIPRLCAQSRDESAVRAAYVFNLIRYVDWPPDKRQLDIGIVGSSSAGDLMQSMLNGRTTDLHTIRVLQSPTGDELQQCGIVYIADQSSAALQIGRLKNKTALTIGESESFVRDGGMVALVKVGDHIQIYINLEAAQRAGVKISSRVLSLAVLVKPAQNAKN
jgi:hypothetical protein